MANGVTAKITGLAALNAALQELVEQTSGRTGKAVVKRALVAAAQPLADRMKANAPKRSGKLAASILVASNGKQVLGKAAFATAKHGGLSDAAAVKALRTAQRDGPAIVVLVGPAKAKSSVASQIEFGVRPHKIRPRRGEVLEIWQGGAVVGVAHEVDHPGAAPKPFLRPAFEETQGEVAETLKTALAAQITKAAARARSRSPKG
jgi:HK97 gp10 family phage protein